MIQFWPPLLVAFLVTASTALVIITNRKMLVRILRERNDGQAIQASHDGNPMRLGGVAIFAGFALGVAVSDWGAPMLPILLLISAIPAALAGLIEDLGYGASARQRLGASFVSAALAAALLATWVTRADCTGARL
jgi:UDP-N-acetylmuramyl pentapeptide phosphotransferase/UDP-N-acetylglucosamine-1-phosphate transferase